MERVAHTVPITDGEREIQYLRSIARRLGEMAADADRRRREFEEAKRLASHANKAQSLLGGVGEAVDNVLEEAERWVPGHWEAGEWIPGFYVRGQTTVRAVAPGLEVRARAIWEFDVPGRFGPRTWVEGRAVPHTGLRIAGKTLGRAMNVLDVGFAAWEDWSKYSDLRGGERAARAAWAGVTLGGGSVLGGAAGYTAGYAVGMAAAGVLVASAPVLLPAAGAVAVVGGIGGAIIGSEFGKKAGGVAKKVAEGVGRRVMGWFR